MLQFFNEDAGVFRPPFTPDVVVVNPPWDMRLGGAVDSWRNLLQFLKVSAHFSLTQQSQLASQLAAC
jgi:23S rRNA G2445 N2-methylase RlmL